MMHKPAAYANFELAPMQKPITFTTSVVSLGNDEYRLRISKGDMFARASMLNEIHGWLWHRGVCLKSTEMMTNRFKLDPDLAFEFKMRWG